MAVNKVIYGSNTLIDLTNDTVTADSLLSGITAHSKDGITLTGTLTVQRFFAESSEPDVSRMSENDIWFVTEK